MQDKELLGELLAAETEEAALAALDKRGLLTDPMRWRYLGGLANNQSIVLAQQSSPTAALVEKFTNGLDAILLRHCKAVGVDPRDPAAPQTMAKAVEKYFGDLSEKETHEIRKLAEENFLLYATGSKLRPCLSLYDAGEGQLAEDFHKTFCSLISANATEGSYKGAIPFVQGRFNMGGTGVLPFCSVTRKMQLIVSRVPDDVIRQTGHEWAFTVFCFFTGRQDPSWKYLIGPDRKVLTAGSTPLRLVPKAGARSGEVCAPRERSVPAGTLIKMYEYQAPRSNICGELFKKLGDYLLRPALPMRLVECRSEYKANVMANTVWDRLGTWAKNKLEGGFEEGASIQIKLTTGETVPAEIRVFKVEKGKTEDEQPMTGLRALVNGQSHAKRDAQFFRTKAVDKEHIAGSLLVTLDCTDLGQASRNALFMSNRENFREDLLQVELLRKLQKELHDHEGLIELNNRRYKEKIADAISDEDGINALEQLLSTDPSLAELFGSMVVGKAAAPTAVDGSGYKIVGEPEPFKGAEFPTYFRRADGSTAVELDFPKGGATRVAFRTDAQNNYFSRRNHRGKCEFQGAFTPTFHLFNGRLTFTFQIDKRIADGTSFTTTAEITDNAGSGPFKLTIVGRVVASVDKPEPEPRPPRDKKVDAVPSRPDIKEVDNGPEDPPITIEKNPATQRLQLLVNNGSRLLSEAKVLRPKEEEDAVAFVFKYGLALVAMGLLDAVKRTPEWQADEKGCRERIQNSAIGVARVIVPLCLTLPKKLPKAA